MQPAISIIVPIYNTEIYLLRCLDSLCRQSLQEIEILLIDDASTDQCGVICESYAHKDSRIRVFHQKENKGLSAARNLGIDNAVGDWLMFVDSDDHVHPDFCKIPYECAMKQDADLVIFGFKQQISSEAGKPQFKIVTVPTGSVTRDEAIEMSFTSFGAVAWNKLYHKTLFINIRYPEGCLYEDTSTTYKLFWNAKHVYCTETVLYYYNLLRPGSITASPKTKKNLQQAFSVSLQHCNDLAQWGYISEKLQQQYIDIAFNYCIWAKPDSTDDCYLKAAGILKNCNSVPKGLSPKRKLLFFLFKSCPQLFHLLCKLYKRQIDIV